MTSRSVFTKFVYFFLIVFLLGWLSTVITTSAAPNSASGILTFVEAEFNDPGLDNPRSVVVSPNGEYVYIRRRPAI